MKKDPTDLLKRYIYIYIFVDKYLPRPNIGAVLSTWWFPRQQPKQEILKRNMRLEFFMPICWRSPKFLTWRTCGWSDGEIAGWVKLLSILYLKNCGYFFEPAGYLLLFRKTRGPLPGVIWEWFCWWKPLSSFAKSHHRIHRMGKPHQRLEKHTTNTYTPLGPLSQCHPQTCGLNKGLFTTTIPCITGLDFL